VIQYWSEGNSQGTHALPRYWTLGKRHSESTQLDTKQTVNNSIKVGTPTGNETELQEFNGNNASTYITSCSAVDDKLARCAASRQTAKF